MTKITCIFCNQTKDKAKEHIWPKWLQKHLIGTSKFGFTGTHLSLSSATVLSHRKQSGETLVFGNICNDCNNGWMNDLEVTFKPLFKKLQNDYKNLININKEERRIISLWSFKTALMINAASNYRKIVPLVHFQNFYLYRQIPKNVKIEVTYINSDEKLSWEQGNIMFSIIKNQEKYKPDYSKIANQSYVITMQLEKLGIKVIYFENCKELGYEIPLSKDNLALRIWPFKKNGKFRISNNYNDIGRFQLDTMLIKNASS